MSTPDDWGLGELRVPGEVRESVRFAPRGAGVVLHTRVPARPATSGEPKRDAEDRVLYVSLPTDGRVVRREDYVPGKDSWLRALRVCDPSSGRTLTLDESYDDVLGPFLVGYVALGPAELGLAP